MQVTILDVKKEFPNEKDSNESTVYFSVGGLKLRAFYDGREFFPQEEKNVRLLSFEIGILDEPASLENSKKEKKLLPEGDWSYLGYGQIISHSPTTVDFGGVNLEIGLDVDESWVGQFIVWKIDRLDIVPE